jgi:hypothetical protein
MTDTSIVQPRSPNAQLTVTAGQEWVDQDTGESLGLAMSPERLNNTAAPTVSIPDGSITAIELSSPFIKRMASLYTGRRATLTVASNINVPYGDEVFLGSTNLTGTVGPRIQVGQVRNGPIFTGYIASSNGVTNIAVYARNNNSIVTQKVPAGTVLKLIAF